MRRFRAVPNAVPLGSLNTKVRLPDGPACSSNPLDEFPVGMGSHTESSSHGDDVSASLALPFSFDFYGVTRTSVNLTSNGLACFGTTVTTGANTALPLAAATDLILVWHDDLRTDAFAGLASGSPAPWSYFEPGIFASVFGDTPHRSLQIEWRATFKDIAGYANFTLTLYEGSTSFDFAYGNSYAPGPDAAGAMHANGASATVGAQKDGATFVEYSHDAAVLKPGTRLRFDYISGNYAVTAYADAVYPKGRKGASCGQSSTIRLDLSRL